MDTMKELSKETAAIHQQIITVSKGIDVCKSSTEKIPNLEHLFEAIVDLKNSVSY